MPVPTPIQPAPTLGYAGVKDFFIEVCKGQAGGHVPVNKFGRNSDVDSAAAEDIWDAGAVWVAPTQARTHNIASDSTNDDGDTVGTGARTIRVYGLKTWSTAESSEDITMDGVSNVLTANSYVIIHRMKVLTWGSAGPNDGVITATATTDGTVTAQINAGEGQTQMAIYGVPSSKTALVLGFYCSLNKGTGATTTGNAILKLNENPTAELTSFTTKHSRGLTNAGESGWYHPFPLPKIFAGPCIIKVTGDTSADDADFSAGFDALLVNDS